MIMQAEGQVESLSTRERELAAIIGAYNDVTQRLKDAHERLHAEVGRLREELRVKNAELRRAERLAALGEMAAGLAHEIRNPLGGISLYASMLERELSGSTEVNAKGAAGRISQGVRTLERLISQILEFAQEHRLQRRSFAMSELIGGVEEDLRPWLAQTGATLAIEPWVNDVWAYGDPEKLRQVLFNLLLNAVQAAGPNGRVWFTVASRETEQDIEWMVCDSGPGIPEDKLNRIFNPFFTTKASGTGLGLAIVHRIVEAHSGTIRAGNRPEGGARFVVSLPGPTLDAVQMDESCEYVER